MESTVFKVSFVKLHAICMRGYEQRKEETGEQQKVNSINRESEVEKSSKTHPELKWMTIENISGTRIMIYRA